MVHAIIYLLPCYFKDIVANYLILDLTRRDGRSEIREGESLSVALLTKVLLIFY